MWLQLGSQRSVWSHFRPASPDLIQIAVRIGVCKVNNVWVTFRSEAVV